MRRDILFLLPPGFVDNGRREYCPECAEVWGVLSYYPAVKEALEIRYLEIEKPRQEIVSMIGEDNQNCPTLILNNTSPAEEIENIKTTKGYRFLDNARDIGKYWAKTYGCAWPRGS